MRLYYPSMTIFAMNSQHRNNYELWYSKQKYKYNKRKKQSIKQIRWLQSSNVEIYQSPDEAEGKDNSEYLHLPFRVVEELG